MPDISQHPWKCAWTTTSLRPQREPNDSIFKTKPLSKAVQHTAFYQTLLPDMQNSHQAWKVHHFFPGKQLLQGKEESTLPDMEKMSIFLGNQFLQGKGKFMDTGTFTLGTNILISLNFLNRYSALSTLTHPDFKPGTVPQNFQ